MLAFINMNYNQREYGKAESRKKKKLNHPEFHPLSYFRFVFYLCVEFNFCCLYFWAEVVVAVCQVTMGGGEEIWR